MPLEGCYEVIGDEAGSLEPAPRAIIVPAKEQARLITVSRIATLNCALAAGASESALRSN
jgi:hypothetical protein